MPQAKTQLKGKASKQSCIRDRNRRHLFGVIDQRIGGGYTDLLERCAQRAGGYDRENRFFMEDFEKVRQTNYLLAAVPQEFAGLGLSHVEVCRERRRVSAVLAINMPLLTTGIAADLWRKGDSSRV